jgi:bacteriophage CI repressor helix-turn-helix domain
MAASPPTGEFLRPVYRISTVFARFFSNVAFGCGPETLPWWTCLALFGKIGAEAREELPMNFSEKLIRLRKREGISQEELASYLEVSRQAVSRWEQGTALPDAGNLLKLRQRFGVSLDWLLDDSQGWENLTDGAPTADEDGGAAPLPKLRKSVLPWAIPLGVSGFGLLLLGIFSSVFPAEYMVASTVIAGNQEPADRIYRGLAGFLKCNNLEWLFRLCLVIAIGSLLAGLWQKGVMKRFEDAVDHKLDELGEKNRDASA